MNYCITKNKPTENPVGLNYKDAEREGFEPPVPLGTAVFKTAVIDHSTISPSFFTWRGHTVFGVQN